MKALLSIAFCTILMFLFFSAKAQDSFQYSRKALLSQTSVSLYAQEERGKGKVIPETGSHPIVSLMNRTWSGGFETSWPFSENSALLVGAGGGVMGKNVYVPGFEDPCLQPLCHVYLGYGKVEVGYEHRLLLKKDWLFTASGKYGLLIHQYLDLASSSSISYSQDSSVTLYEMHMDLTEDQPFHFFDVHVGIGRFTNKTHNVWSLRLGYRRAFQPILELDYKSLVNTNMESSGIYRNDGRAFYLGLAYRFNSYKKLQFNGQNAINDPSANRKSIKQRRRYELETQRSNSWRLRATAGANTIYERLEDESHFVSGYSAPGTSLALAVTRENPNFYHGGMLHYHSWFTSYWVPNALFTSHLSNAQAIQLGYVLGSYWRNKAKTRRFLQYEAGLHIGANQSMDGLYHAGVSSPDSFMLAEIKEPIRVYPIVHLGVSSSIRLYEQLYWDFGVKYFQGFFPFYTEKITYRNWNGVNLETEKTSNGRSWVFETGISIHLSR